MSECARTLRKKLDHEQRMCGYLAAALQAHGDGRGLFEIIEWARKNTLLPPMVKTVQS